MRGNEALYTFTVSVHPREELLDSTVRGGDHWRYDKARSGGGVLVDGATHWIRPLRIW